MNIDCNLFREMIFPYLDDNLTDEATACFLEHARICPECQAALEEARSFEFGLIGTFVNLEPPQDLADNIMSNLHTATTLFADVEAAAAPKKKVVKLSKKRVFGAIGTVAAAAALVIAVNVAGLTGTDDTNKIQIADEDTAISDEVDGKFDFGHDKTDNKTDGEITTADNLDEEDSVSKWGVFGAGSKTGSSSNDSSDGKVYHSIFGDRGSSKTPSKKPSSSGSSISNSKPSNSKPSNSGSSNNQSNTNKPSNGNSSSNTNKPSGGNTGNNNNSNNNNNNNQNTSDVKLPEASFGTETVGTMNQRLVAAYEKDNIYMPSVSLDGKTAVYYTKINDDIYMWKTDLSVASKPVCEGVVEDKNFDLKNTTTIYNVNTSIFSPDMSMLSMNARGDNSGVWVSDVTNGSQLSKLCDEGGGDILAWAPNSSKFVFTDESGSLYVAYPVEKRIVTAFEGKVTDVAWGSDNKTLVLTAKQDNGQIGLYTIQIP